MRGCDRIARRVFGMRWRAHTPGQELRGRHGIPPTLDRPELTLDVERMRAHARLEVAVLVESAWARRAYQRRARIRRDVARVDRRITDIGVAPAVGARVAPVDGRIACHASDDADRPTPHEATLSPLRRRTLHSAQMRGALVMTMVAASGCTLILDYRDPAPDEVGACHNGRDDDRDGPIDCDDDECAAECIEASAVACSNSIDDDADGDTNCADDDCDGFCPESSFEACGNSRDDDGDGRSDLGDAECWPIRGDLVIERCATIGGGALSTIGGDRVYSTGPVAPVSTPDGMVIGNILGDPPFAVRHDEPALYASAATLRGGLGSVSIDLVLEEGTRVFAGFVAEESAPLEAPLLADAPSRSTGVILDTSEGSLRILGPDHDELLLPRGVAPGEIRLTLGGDEDGQVFILVRGDGLTEATPLPDGLRDVPRSRAVIQVDGRVTVRSFDVELVGHDPCEHPVPELPSTREGAIDLGAPPSVAVSGEVRCALAIGCVLDDVGWRRALTVWRSDGTGASWTESPELGASSARSPIAAAAVAVDTSFVAAVVRVDPSAGDGSVTLYESADCVEWTARESLDDHVPLDVAGVGCDPNASEVAAIAYLERDGEPLLWYAFRDGDRIGVQTSAGLAWSATRHLPRFLRADLPISATMAGERDIVLFHRLTIDPPRSIGVTVWPAGQEPLRASVGELFAPSLEEGSFDRFEISSAAVSWEGEQRATLYYAGRGDALREDGGRLGRVGSARFEIMRR